MFGAVTTQYGSATTVTATEVQCGLNIGRRRRSTSTTTGTQYTVSVSNGGTSGTFGSSQSVIEIDSSCQSITTDANNETVITLQVKIFFQKSEREELH